MWNEKPLGFLAQINLEEVAPFDVENLLPKTGLLSFFYFSFDCGYFWNDASMFDSWRVFHFQTVSQRAVYPPELNSPQSEQIESCSIRIEPEWTTETDPDLEIDFEEIEQLHDVFFEKFHRPLPRHRLLGWPNPVQSEVAEKCAEYSGDLDWSDAAKAQRAINQWRLLLQVDADYQGIGPEWGDMGTNFYMIRQNDLTAQSFSAVWFISECG